ncbi:MAG: OmpA family protein [Magnetococcales bacterium]|nr:OmpA family protein [Magnetococcales bacterium]
MARFLARRQRAEETADSPFWISFADLMTALVMLFLVVMSISMVAIASRSMVEKKARSTEISTVLDTLNQQVEAEGLQGLDINRANHTISFGMKANFAHNSFFLSEEAKEKLQAFVPLLLEVHNKAEGKRWLKRIHIEGYTDETGTYLYNVNMSLNRAMAVVCTLLSADLPPEKHKQLRELLIIDGASTTSVKDNPDDSRRVEIRLEFRQLGEEELNKAAVDMPLGHCAIPTSPEQVTTGWYEKKGRKPSQAMLKKAQKMIQQQNNKPIEQPVQKQIKSAAKEAPKPLVPLNVKKQQTDTLKTESVPVVSIPVRLPEVPIPSPLPVPDQRSINSLMDQETSLEEKLSNE